MIVENFYLISNSILKIDLSEFFTSLFTSSLTPRMTFNTIKYNSEMVSNKITAPQAECPHSLAAFKGLTEVRLSKVWLT